MKIAISGGHFTPALAVIEALQKKDPDLSVLFLGRKSTFGNDQSLSLEYKSLADKKNIIFVNINSGRFQRFLTWQNLLTPLAVILGFIQAFYYLVKFKADLILSFGGYLSVPMVLAGWINRIPIISHEQGFSPGLATKINAVFSSKICVSWNESLKYFPAEKTVLTGNPICENTVKTNKFRTPFPWQRIKLPVIFITGGNQGSHTINLVARELLEFLLPRFIVIHQCGGHLGNSDEIQLKTYAKTLAQTSQRNYFAVSHISSADMGSIYDRSALVIGRSGINTISELIYFQKKAILIPLPFAQGKEQEINARFLESLGLGVVIKQEDLTAAKLKETIEFILRNDEKTDQTKISSISLFLKNAAGKIGEEVYKLYGQESNH